MRKAYIVVGCGFGDEGKGLATDYLCRQSSFPLVIRYNGGQQAGHTVAGKDGRRHVFSNFGAGTLSGAPTYWSSYCTFSPGSFLKELEHLKKICTPKIFIDKLCPVTTHYEVLYNRACELARGTERHGSCGLGFGATIERQENSPYRIFAQDLLFPELLRIKLLALKKYYDDKFIGLRSVLDFRSLHHDSEDEKFVNYSAELLKLLEHKIIGFVTPQEIFSEKNPWQTLVFEGAQGILLDMDFGFFPHVTRSNTTSRNALSLIRTYLKNIASPEIFYITRCYQTRHGEGPMTNNNHTLQLINNENETNVYNEHQGNFRISPLDIDLLNYALTCDDNFSSGLQKNMIVTCLDQLQDDYIPFTRKGVLDKIHFTEIHTLIETRLDKLVLNNSVTGPDAPLKNKTILS